MPTSSTADEADVSPFRLGRAQLQTLELVDAPMWLMSPQSASITWANPSALRLWGVASSESLVEGAAPRGATRPGLESIWRAARDLEPGQVLRLDEDDLLGDTAHRSQVVVRLVETDFADEVLLLVEAALGQAIDDQSAARALDVLSTMPSAAAIFDLDGTLIWENAASRRVFASRRGRRPSLEERLADPAAAQGLLGDLGSRRKTRAEFELATARGRRWALLDARVGTDSATGRPAYIIGHSDIHRWKCAELDLRDAKELAENASKSKSEFLANMSHEIRTPMNGVMGAIELLERSSLDEPQHKMVGTIRRSARTLLTILDDILDLSRIEAGKLRLEEIEFDPVEVLQDLLSLHEQNARRKNVELRSAIDQDLPETLIGDPVRLGQVVGNLLSNAIKFTSEGFVEMTAEVDKRDDGHLRLRVEVSDTGCGIDEEEQLRIFRAFEQADGSVTRRYGGTGLGLTISRQITSLMDGQMGVSSALGEGSRFWFTVVLTEPRVETSSMDGDVVSLAHEGVKVAKGADPSGLERALRVLLVEDNPINQEVALAMLELLHCEVDCAGDGAQAMVAVVKNEYDLVLMDCQMPVLDGLTATELIRQRESCDGGRVPIIALTANAMNGDRERCLEVGMDDFLAKPFTVADLETKLRRWGCAR